MLSKKITSFALIAALSTPVWAFQTLSTSDTGTLGAKANSVDYTLNASRARSEGNTDRVYDNPFTYTRGITDSLDIYVGGTYTRMRPNGEGNASAFGNSSLGSIWRFYDNEASGTSFALKPSIIFPINATHEREGLGVGKTSGNVALLFTQNVSFGSVSANLGLGQERYREGISSNVNSSRLSVLSAWKISEAWKIGMEVGARRANGNGERATQRFVGTAAIYAPNKTLDLEIGTGFSRDNRDPRTNSQTISAGLTVNF